MDLAVGLGPRAVDECTLVERLGGFEAGGHATPSGDELWQWTNPYSFGLLGLLFTNKFQSFLIVPRVCRLHHAEC
jgi:hypothetical protein